MRNAIMWHLWSTNRFLTTPQQKLRKISSLSHNSVRKLFFHSLPDLFSNSNINSAMYFIEFHFTTGVLPARAISDCGQFFVFNTAVTLKPDDEAYVKHFAIPTSENRDKFAEYPILKYAADAHYCKHINLSTGYVFHHLLLQAISKQFFIYTLHTLHAFSFQSNDVSFLLLNLQSSNFFDMMSEMFVYEGRISTIPVCIDDILQVTIRQP